MGLLRNERTTRLGRIGEQLAAERLEQNGFSEVEDLNATQANYPFADIFAVRHGQRFLISVKTRNEMRQGNATRNESYNLVQIRDRPKTDLQRQGKTTGEITRMLLEEVSEQAKSHEAVPAWVTVAVRPGAGTYSAYFGLVSDLGNTRAIPMTTNACRRHDCLARDVVDARITADLLNT